MKTNTEIDQYLTCVRRCPAWQECGIWCARAPGMSPSRDCEWWPGGMPRERVAPRSALAPEPRRRNVGAALVALCGIVAMAGMLALTFVIIYVLLSLAVRAI